MKKSTIIPPKPIRAALRRLTMYRLLLIIGMFLALVGGIALILFIYPLEDSGPDANWGQHLLIGVGLLILIIMLGRKFYTSLLIFWIQQEFQSTRTPLLLGYIIYRRFFPEPQRNSTLLETKEENTRYDPFSMLSQLFFRSKSHFLKNNEALEFQIKNQAKQYMNGSKDMFTVERNIYEPYRAQRQYVHAGNIVSFLKFILVIIVISISVDHSLGSLVIGGAGLVGLIFMFTKQEVRNIVVSLEGILIDDTFFEWKEISQEHIVSTRTGQSSPIENRNDLHQTVFLSFEYQGTTQKYNISHLNARALADALYEYRIGSGR